MPGLSTPTTPQIEPIGPCLLAQKTPSSLGKQHIETRRKEVPENSHSLYQQSGLPSSCFIHILILIIKNTSDTMQGMQIHHIPYKNSQIKYNKAVKSNYTNDIIPGVYEGGYKLWECTLDLLKYMSENQLNLVGKTVMDIGCGHGLLGIAAIKCGADVCYFQDFNKEVVEGLTYNNTIINDVDTNRCRFVYGDWDNLIGMQGNQKFDLLIGSEIIYKEQNYAKIMRLCQKYLKPDGKAILANKYFYFGVGGNMDDFRDALEKNGLSCQTLVKITPPKGGNKKQIVSVCLGE